MLDEYLDLSGPNDDGPAPARTRAQETSHQELARNVDTERLIDPCVL